MQPEWNDVAEQVLVAAKRMVSDRLVTGSAGNISARIPGSELAAITPTRVPYERLTPGDIVIIDLEGNVVGGSLRPSSEVALHTLILRERPDVQAVVHTHSPYATALSVLREAIPLVCNEGLAVRSIKVEVARYEMPETARLGLAAMELLARDGDARAILLANHGVLAIGDSLAEAYRVAVNVEAEAQIYCIARSVGVPMTISKEQLGEIRKLFSTLGRA